MEWFIYFLIFCLGWVTGDIAADLLPEEGEDND